MLRFYDGKLLGFSQIIINFAKNLMMMKTVERLLAEKLLKIRAIILQPNNPFTWASGWNSPIYTDNRKTLSYPDIRSLIKVELSRDRKSVV